jgi:hypothetical protein
MADAVDQALAESLEALRREVPAAYRAMCQALDARELCLRVDGAPIVLAFSGESHRFLARPGRAPIEIRTAEETLHQLIDGELSLLEAVLSERVVVLASIDDLLRCEEGLSSYLRGAVRSPSFPRILERRRAAIGRGRE